MCCLATGPKAMGQLWGETTKTGNQNNLSSFYFGYLSCVITLLENQDKHPHRKQLLAIYPTEDSSLKYIFKKLKIQEQKNGTIKNGWNIGTNISLKNICRCQMNI
jgi:hypothetical protein